MREWRPGATRRRAASHAAMGAAVLAVVALVIGSGPVIAAALPERIAGTLPRLPGWTAAAQPWWWVPSVLAVVAFAAAHRLYRSAQRAGRADGEAGIADDAHEIPAWARAGRAQRAVAAALFVLAVLAVAAKLAGIPNADMAALVVGAVGGAWAGWAIADGIALMRHRWRWIAPTAVAIRPVLGLPSHASPNGFLRVPVDYADREGEILRCEVPPEWTRADDGPRERLQKALETKLGLQDVAWSWRMAGRQSFAIARVAQRPPDRAPFAEPSVRALVESAKESAPLIGLSAGSKPVAVDLDAESPHVLVNAGTGGGKSVILRTISAQAMRHGAALTVLDVKRHSHKWCRGLDRVTYARDLEDIHDALIRLRAEGHRRNAIADAHDGDPESAPVGPRQIVLVEEANATIGALKKHWATVRDPKTDPKDSPAIDGLREVLFMGRAVRMHVIMVAQSATAAALGGSEVRENFATRILARYSQNAWRMLVPEVHPIPRSTRHIGRAQVVLGGTATATQVVLMTDAEAREWAKGPVSASSQVSTSHPAIAPADLAKWPETVAEAEAAGDDASMQAIMQAGMHASGGEPAPTAPTTPPPAGNTPDTTQGSKRPENAPPKAPTAPPPVEPITLREACETGVLACSLAVARKASTGRDPEFPTAVDAAGPGGGKRYDPAALRRWERNRPKAGRSPAANEGDAA